MRQFHKNQRSWTLSFSNFSLRKWSLRPECRSWRLQYHSLCADVFSLLCTQPRVPQRHLEENRSAQRGRMCRHNYPITKQTFVDLTLSLANHYARFYHHEAITVQSFTAPLNTRLCFHFSDTTCSPSLDKSRFFSGTWTAYSYWGCLLCLLGFWPRQNLVGAIKITLKWGG